MIKDEIADKKTFMEKVMKKRRWGDSTREDNEVLDFYNSLPNIMSLVTNCNNKNENGGKNNQIGGGEQLKFLR